MNLIHLTKAAILALISVTLMNSCTNESDFTLAMQHELLEHQLKESSFVDLNDLNTKMTWSRTIEGLFEKYPLRDNDRLSLYKSLAGAYKTDNALEQLAIRYVSEYQAEKELFHKLNNNDFVSNTFHVGFVPDPYPGIPNMLRIESRIDYKDGQNIPYFVNDATGDTTVLDTYEDTILLPNEEGATKVAGTVWIFNYLLNTWIPYKCSIDLGIN